MVKVSVIIPVYNVEEYLEECIDSVLSQTLQDFEIICVNDGSTDGSRDILVKYAHNDSRIKVLDKENGGASSARNKALSNAVGKYVYFLDSDDYIREDALQFLYDKAEENGLDITFFGAECFFDDENTGKKCFYEDKYFSREVFLNEVLSGSELLLGLAENNKFNVSVPCQFLNREFLVSSGVRFFEGIIYEDELFSPLVLIKATKTMIIPDNLYMRRVRQGSVMTTKVSTHNVNSFVTVFNKLMQEYVFGIYDDLSKQALFECSKIIYYSYKSHYNELNRREKEKAKGIDCFLEKKFELKCIEYYEKMEKKEGCVELQADQCDTTVNNLDKNKEAIYFIRKIKGAIQCCRDHGLIYTIKLSCFKANRYLKSRIAPKNLHDEDYESGYDDIEIENDDGYAISVVIPVYNAEPYLDECLGSVFNQTFKNFEVICVDDGSTDRSLEILKKYENMFSNMKVITQKNQYAGVARNNGMAVASGRYIMFMDADDFIDEKTLEYAYRKAKKEDADVVVFGVYSYDNNEGIVTKADWHLITEYLPDKKSFSYKDIPDYILNFTAGGPCNKLFSKKLIDENGLKFPPFRNLEDFPFVLSCFVCANRITTVNKYLYYYRMGMETNLSSIKDKHHTLFLDAYEYFQIILKEMGIYEKVKRSFVNFAMGGCIYEINSIKDPELRKEAIKLFLTDYIYRFEIADKPKPYFFLEYRYEEYMEMKRKHNK